ncbi:unnamed protein product [Spirodela intermedia]|uniref:protein-serine/threonine phosphatase n=1 Tax=Spirodela intermedia TaxID=51605 RepID=A0A7I8IAM7_SPIIN|nr:unnamed protein product [Spirodela intermedia]CAA6654739.1 unnamed protein product [Spirodela intermedia]
MACSVAVAGASPVFSPSHRKISLTCKASPEGLTLSPDIHAPGGLPSAAAVSSSCSSSSPYRLRLPPGGSGLRGFFSREALVPVDSSGEGCAAVALEASSPAGTGTSAVLKRKRPARIHIPAMQPLDFASRPSRGDEEVEQESSRFSVFCKRGRKRKEMEDRHKASSDGQGGSQMAFFGIFDGHGGTTAAEFAANNMDKHIMGEMAAGRETNGCHRYEERRQSRKAPGGVSCVTALITDGDLIVSNAGDCRAVMSSAGAAEALTSDHRPSRKDERDRIESLGGYLDYRRGLLRLHGSLAVSRGIGDGHLKQWVTAEPETRVLRIQPEFEFLILASDGLWDKVSNQEAVDTIRPLCVQSGKQSLLSACKKLVDLSVGRGSVDDVSVMIVLLRDFL